VTGVVGLNISSQAAKTGVADPLRAREKVAQDAIFLELLPAGL